MAKRKKPDQPVQGVTAMRTRRAGKPLLRAKIAPLPGSPKKRRLDILKGQFVVSPEFFEPLPEEELNSWGR
ncbi:MAG TPA: hypothetical protein VKM93_08335 [Terriglobia bacterium]|nr:hypothetical protein [Terriglobia bacterium]